MPALTFFKCSPGGNTTVLLVDTGLSPDQHEHVAGILLSPLHLHAEQVGFITLHKPSLRMAGGEFCVNGARSLGALLALQGLLIPNEDGMLCATVPVSGISSPVQLEVEALTCGLQRTLNSAAIVPLPSLCGELCTQLEEGIVLVRLPGISHVLLDAARHPLCGHWTEEAAALRVRFGLEKEPAVGCIWWQKARSGADVPTLAMKPVVWVRDLNSTCLESSCGSGAMACALMLRWQEKYQGQAPIQSADKTDVPVSYSLMQPSGIALTVSLLRHNDANYARVSGPVTMLAEGIVYLDSLNPPATNANP